MIMEDLRLFFKNVYLFRRKEVAGEEQMENERENLKVIPHDHRAWLGTQSQDAEIMTWAETKSQTLNHLSYPGPNLCSNS